MIQLFCLSLFLLATSNASERGGNTGGNEILENAVRTHQLIGACDQSGIEVCDLAKSYLQSDNECREKTSVRSCDFYTEVELYSSACCSGSEL